MRIRQQAFVKRDGCPAPRRRKRTVGGKRKCDQRNRGRNDGEHVERNDALCSAGATRRPKASRAETVNEYRRSACRAAGHRSRQRRVRNANSADRSGERQHAQHKGGVEAMPEHKRDRRYRPSHGGRRESNGAGRKRRQNAQNETNGAKDHGPEPERRRCIMRRWSWSSNGHETAQCRR